MADVGERRKVLLVRVDPHSTLQILDLFVDDTEVVTENW